MDQSHRFLKGLRLWYQRLLPNECVLCNSPAQHALCSSCVSDLPVLERACERCALPLHSETTVCGECLVHPPAFDAAISVFSYRGQVPWLINQFKHRNQHAIGRQLTRACVHALPPDALFDMVVPVPLHWARLLQRGFNQAERIAAPIAKHLQRPLCRVVRKRRFSRHQQGLTRRERLTNAQRVFEVRGVVDGKHLLLVDDVMTTGATLESISRLLRRAGATSITVVTLARTPKRGAYN